MWMLPSEWATDIKSASVAYSAAAFSVQRHEAVGPHKSTCIICTGHGPTTRIKNIIEYSVQNLLKNNGATLLVDTPKVTGIKHLANTRTMRP